MGFRFEYRRDTRRSFLGAARNRERSEPRRRTRIRIRRRGRQEEEEEEFPRHCGERGQFDCSANSLHRSPLNGASVRAERKPQGCRKGPHISNSALTFSDLSCSAPDLQRSFLIYRCLSTTPASQLAGTLVATLGVLPAPASLFTPRHEGKDKERDHSRPLLRKIERPSDFFFFFIFYVSFYYFYYF